MIHTDDIVHAKISEVSHTSNYSHFELSEPELPALYAGPVRDYDGGLGLLVVGNKMGELALYSLSGASLDALQDSLRRTSFPPWNGQELIPTVRLCKSEFADLLPTLPPESHIRTCFIFVRRTIARRSCP